MDTAQQSPNNQAPYFNKGKRYYNLGFYFWLGAILLSQLNKLTQPNSLLYNVVDELVGLLMVAEYIIVPVAIVYLLKSYQHKEPHNKYRTFYLIVLFIIAAILLLLLVAILRDMKSWLK